MTKSCVNCRWEPVWKKGINKFSIKKFIGSAKWKFIKVEQYTGFCKCPMPIVVEGTEWIVLGKNTGKDCEAWKPKVPKGGFKFNRRTLYLLRRIKDSFGNYYWKPDLTGKSFDTIEGEPYELID